MEKSIAQQVKEISMKEALSALDLAANEAVAIDYIQAIGETVFVFDDESILAINDNGDEWQVREFMRASVDNFLNKEPF